MHRVELLLTEQELVEITLLIELLSIDYIYKDINHVTVELIQYIPG